MQTWPGSPPAIMRGTNVRTQWTTPSTLTRHSQAQSSSVLSHVAALVVTPALAHTRPDGPERRLRRLGQALDGGGVADVGRDRRHRVGAELVGQSDRGGLQRRRLDVAQRHAGAVAQQAAGQGEPDAARRSGHHGRPSRELEHGRGT